MPSGFPSDEDIKRGARLLARRDPALKRALSAIGAPYVRRRRGGFEGLLRIIVEQQVSVPSAQALWKRVISAHGKPKAAVFRMLTDDDYRAFGFSRPKVVYARALADAVDDGALDFKALKRLPDEDAVEMLTALKGVGPWSAAIYLLFCEGRMDVWPPGDVALMNAYQQAAELPERPSSGELDEQSAGWAPQRGMAAHILWTYYAHLRGRNPI